MMVMWAGALVGGLHHDEPVGVEKNFTKLYLSEKEQIYLNLEEYFRGSFMSYSYNLYR